ncbi:MICOS complex subunit MIC25 [Bactrocera neohumeralis]|uniref:MICOS complex subunit MIC25 n=1 Tax=Bactrocera tryoni TaxID=59916 RepID=UPI001A975AAC|nr:MICOS complex subunit MIC25 [Bactrocera tryoni]XP_050318164.1 MICOS complex subunit MIC25 [Bactrocera neohumeralis]
MGAAHSTEPRSVSMDNPNPGVIDISDEVVQRLKKGINKQAKESAAAEAAPAPPVKDVRPIPVKPATPPAVAPPTVVYQAPATQTVYVAPSGTTITAADMVRQKEAELTQNDAMWRQRLVALEETLKKTNTIMEKEYSSALEDVRQRFATASPVHQLPPCQDLKAQVIACYRANPGQTLKCSEEVAAFRECINLNRIKKLDAEDAKPIAKAA